MTAGREAMKETIGDRWMMRAMEWPGLERECRVGPRRDMARVAMLRSRSRGPSVEVISAGER
jgi:hypothetical protein